MKYIKKAIKNLEKKKVNCKLDKNYILPYNFNFFNYEDYKEFKHNQMNVNPYAFYAEGLKAIIKNKPNKDYLQSLSQLKQIKSKNGDWIKQAFVYSSMIRSSSSYDHDQDGQIKLCNDDGFKESGTFLKQIFILSYLKDMGIDTIYLLPFFENSKEFKKGEFGSCYAIRNIFTLDDTLYDPLLDELTLLEQAKAFFEACHILDMRVIIDIIPRTAAIDSTLIKENPDWFYWIDAAFKDDYKLPYYKHIKQLVPPNKKNMELVYQDPSTKKFLSHFCYDPKTSDSEKYTNLVKQCEATNENLLEAIEKEFGVIVAPAFSDWINDPQPVWSDVTYTRMYLDNNELAMCHIEEGHPPYLFFDSAKSSMHPCLKINTELWNKLTNIVPFYQKELGLDGVRIDMGHALPLALVDGIIKEAKKIDSDICFIAEELDISNAKTLKKQGYNMILGNGFSEESRIQQGKLQAFYRRVPNLACPVFALSESHDTSRVSAKTGKKELNIMLSALNLFLPNGVAFINSGQELFEVQPMNLGLDCEESERYNLPKDDPRYNKLALFDPFYFTYNDYDPRLINMLKILKDIRKEYLVAISTRNRHIAASFQSDDIYALGSYLINKDKTLLIVANTDLNNEHEYTSNLEVLTNKTKQQIKSIKEIYSTADNPIPPVQNQNTLFLPFKKGEVKLIEIK
ncbi:starch synthase (maltosyl-transferring) [Breznakia sp. PF5-3]|uniref:alpha-amylase family glycosyl hydrolase n=1 Tax=unclassified Breznakia TaxID=2623764 RepID=UPI00240708EC|nr:MULTISPECIES: alpha-amylase family glycosyl hydrolase [unclassified Breznakia]MDF9824570.1 starch synthase (maltosyl-transferring) [Breznakia sp. PM6-1]MDF9835460.1 starch synthase (maltosyl-transferring) [Breznakia sp. PF5-3]